MLTTDSKDEDTVVAGHSSSVFLRRYVDAVKSLGTVERVFYTMQPEGLKLFTLIRGDRRTIAPPLYSLEAELIREIPDTRVDVWLMPGDHADIETLEQTTRQAFPTV